MSAIIPLYVQTSPIPGLERISVGKVREQYALPDHPELMFVITTDRLSVFDFVLPCTVPNKGVVLNALDLFMQKRVLTNFHHDTVAYGPGIDAYLPRRLRGNFRLHRRCRVIHRARMINRELIFRGRLTGSAWKAYRQGKDICGQTLPPGLAEWSSLGLSLATPSTKAAQGHDVPIPLSEFIADFGGEPITMGRSVYETGRAALRERGIEIVDTKLELGYVGETLTVCDERLTPDSSRFCLLGEVEQAAAEGTKPTSLDKQMVRDFIIKHLGIGPDTEQTPETIARVHAATIPDEIIAQTSERYLQLVRMVTGMSLDDLLASL